MGARITWKPSKGLGQCNDYPVLPTRLVSLWEPRNVFFLYKQHCAQGLTTVLLFRSSLQTIAVECYEKKHGVIVSTDHVDSQTVRQHSAHNTQISQHNWIWFPMLKGSSTSKKRVRLRCVRSMNHKRCNLFLQAMQDNVFLDAPLTVILPWHQVLTDGAALMISEIVRHQAQNPRPALCGAHSE